MPPQDLLGLVLTAPSKPLQGTGYRSVPAKRHDQPLSVIGSRRRSGRFHVAGLADVIYVALDPITAMLEVEALLKTDAGIQPVPVRPRTMFTIEYDLTRVLDLTSPATRDHLRIDMATVHCNWRRMRDEAPT